MQCAKCQTENPQNRKFCRECGSKLLILCPQCGCENAPGDKFCGDCGQSLEKQKDVSRIDYSIPQSYTPKHLADKILTTRTSIEGERKLVTVLFADVANFTILSSKLDPEEVHQIMDGCFRILMDEIHKYEGTINQFTGDGVMALFGAPVAHEDHAQRACHAALAIQKAMSGYGDKIEKEYGVEFRMRMGLNSGPVIVGSIGDDLRMDYTAVGDTTNLASRMESAAKPGSILGTRNTHRLARDFFEFESLGSIEVKGKEEPQDAFERIKTSKVATRIGASVAKGLTRFVGRKQSMAVLIEGWEKAASGAGQVVGIVGEAGVGKSRLLLEMRRALPQGEHTYLEGRCLHFGGSMAYLPILDILRSYFELNEGDREFIIKKNMEKKILDLDEKLTGLLPPFHELLSLKVDDQAFAKLEPKEKRERTFEALRDFLIRLSHQKPLVLAFEDLHWMDKTSQDFLNYLIGWLANTPILLMLLYRPEFTHQWGSKTYYTKIGVNQLSAASSGELVKALLEEGKVAPELKQLILSQSSGNPLFMEEFTHGLLENGTIERKDETYVLSKKVSDIQVPDTIQGIIAARLDRLEDNLKRTMQVASVIGRDFAFRILQTITGMREELKSHLLNLQGLEFIYEKNLFPELEYIFKHALTQEVAYNSLLLKRRKEIHEKIGMAIEELYPERLEEFYEMLAYHYTRSDNIEKACHYSKLAGDKAEGIYSHWEAVAYYKNALELLNKESETRQKQREKLDVVHLTHKAIGLLGFPEGSLEIYEEGVRLSRELQDTRSLAKFSMSIANYHSHRGNAELGLEYSRYAFEEANKIQDIDLMVLNAWSLVVAWGSTGDFGRIVDLVPPVIGLIEKQARTSDFFSMAMNPYSVLCMYCATGMCAFGNIDEGIAYVDNALRNALELNDIRLLGPIEFCYGNCFHIKGDWLQSIAHLRKSIQYSEEVKYTFVAALAQSGLGSSYVMIGDFETGILNAEKGLETHRATGVEMHLPSSYYFSSLAHLEVGDLDTARSLAEETMRLSQKNNEQALNGLSKMLLGKILGIASSSQTDEAEDLIKEGIEILKQLRARSWYSFGYLFLGEIYLNANRIESAKENLVKAEGMFQEMGMDYWLQRTRGILERL